MKHGSLLVAAAVFLACGVASQGQGLSLNFSANTGGAISFAGTNDMFNFTPGTNGYQWNITSETGGSSALGLNGNFLNGPFDYGAITTNGSGLFQIQSAPVTGPLGNVRIYDGSGYLSATVNFMNVTTFYEAVGVLNSAVNVNLTSIMYSGSNPDLETLAGEQPGTLDLSFQFSPGMTLGQLSSGSGPFSTSYSGSIAVVPEPSTLAFGAFGGLVALAAYRSRK